MMNRKVVNSVLEDVRLKVTLAGMICCGLAVIGILVMGFVLFS